MERNVKPQTEWYARTSDDVTHTIKSYVFKP